MHGLKALARLRSPFWTCPGPSVAIEMPLFVIPFLGPLDCRPAGHFVIAIKFSGFGWSENCRQRIDTAWALYSSVGRKAAFNQTGRWDSDSENLGSNPSSPARHNPCPQKNWLTFARRWPFYVARFVECSYWTGQSSDQFSLLVRKELGFQSSQFKVHRRALRFNSNT